jgi:transposase
MQTMERDRLQILPKNIASTITPILTAIKNQIAKIEAKIAKLIDTIPEYQAKNKLLQSIPGVGKIWFIAAFRGKPLLSLMKK